MAVSWNGHEAIVPQVNRTRAGAQIQRITRWMQGTLVVAILAGLGRVGVTDRAMTLAAQAFTSILPVMILITALPVDGPIARAMEHIGSQWLSLDPSAPVTADPSTATFGIAGVLMTLIGATSFARALDRMYADAWQQPKLGLAGWWRWPLIIVTMVIGITIEVFLVRGVAYPGPLSLIETALSAVLWTLIWAAVIALLTAGQIAPLGVWATAAGTGLAVALYFYGTQLAFTRLLSGTELRYGTLGIVFAVIGWLFLYAWIVVALAVVVAVVWTHFQSPTSGNPAATGPGGEAPSSEPAPDASPPQRGNPTGRRRSDLHSVDRH